MTTRGVLCTFLGAAAAVAAVKRSDREIYHLFDLFVSSLTLLPMLYARLVCFKKCGQNCFEVPFEYLYAPQFFSCVILCLFKQIHVIVIQPNYFK